MKEFINPKSMLTPGVAGSLMMLLVNGITYQFPEFPARYLALLLSLLIGAIVWSPQVKEDLPRFQKPLYWILNSMVIFVVGFGTANLAANAKTPGIANNWLYPLVTTSYAQVVHPQVQQTPTSDQPNVTTNDSLNSQDVKALKEELAKEREKNSTLTKQLESQKDSNEKSKATEEKTFFKQW
jgi:hypothetical protein